MRLAVNSEEFAIAPPSGSECGATGEAELAPGSSCDVRVAFAPAQRGQRNATLSVSSSAGSVGLNLNGVGLAPAELRARGAVDFGGLTLGSTVARVLGITNVGDQPLGEVATRLSAPDAADFAVQQNGCSPGLANGAGCSVSMAFTPTGSGSRLGTPTLVGTPGATRNVRLSGFGLDAGVLVLAPAAGSSQNFGAGLAVGSTNSRTQSFVLSNPGQTPSGTLTLGPLGGGFRVAAPSGMHDHRGVPTRHDGQLRRRGGTGPRPRQRNPVVDRRQHVGSSAEPLMFTTSNQREFPVIDNTCAGSLAAGGQCVLAMQLAPTAVGPRSALLTLSAGRQSVSAMVTGVGY